MKAMLSQKQHGQLHPQLWDNLLRPQGEHFDAAASSSNSDENNSNNNNSRTGNSPLIVKSRLAAQNKFAQQLGVATREKLKLDNIADYDAIVGLPVAAIEPEHLVDFFPGYTKFILVEETNKPEWVRQHIEDGIVPILINLRNMMDKSPTGKVWYSLFRHFAWPGSSSDVIATLPSESETNGEMIQPSFIQKIKSGVSRGGAPDKPVAAPGSTLDGASTSTTKVGDIRMVQARKQIAEEALADYEKRVKAAIPADRLYVYREGDGWEPLLHFTGKDFTLLETLPEKFPDACYGKEFLDLVRFRVVRTVMITKFVNATAVLFLIFVAWMLNGYFIQGVERIVDDAKKVTGQI